MCCLYSAVFTWHFNLNLAFHKYFSHLFFFIIIFFLYFSLHSSALGNFYANFNFYNYISTFTFLGTTNEYCVFCWYTYPPDSTDTLKTALCFGGLNLEWANKSAQCCWEFLLVHVPHSYYKPGLSPAAGSVHGDNSGAAVGVNIPKDCLTSSKLLSSKY